MGFDASIALMMIPKTRRELIPMLEAAGIKPHKKWGQSLLLDGNMLEAIARDADIGSDDLVLEIGPGPATLTEYLMERAGFVVAAEIDRGMVAFVAEALSGSEKLVLLNEDILEEKNTLNARVVEAVSSLLAGNECNAENAALIAPNAPKTFSALKVVANLPYSIASPTLIAILESPLSATSMTLLLQKEVADKLMAPSGGKDYGLLTLLCALSAEVEHLRDVPATCFWPRPKVVSSLIRVTPYASRLDEEEYDKTKRVISGLMGYRRKNLTNAAQHGLGMERDDASAWFERAGIDAKLHASQLTLDQFKALAASSLA